MLDLDDAIARLYVAFSAVPKPHAIDGCPCCLGSEEIETLLAKPLWDLGAADLSFYAADAFLTLGSQADYLYFLPRILEITATQPSWTPDFEMTARAVRSSEPATWTASQRTALDDYLMSMLGKALRAGGCPDIDSVVCAVGRMGREVRPHLAEIAKSPAAVLSYFEANVDDLQRNRLGNAFWEVPCPAHDAVVDWFFSDEIAKIPFDAYGCAVTRPAAQDPGERPT